MRIPPRARCLIIAEAGVNHNGSLVTAQKMVRAAARAGADFVKFQTFNPEALATATAPQAAYQKKTTGGRVTQKKMLQKVSLSKKQFYLLKKECQRQKIGFLSTAFDSESLTFVESLRPKFHKISSGDIDNQPLLRQAAEFGRPILLSTGMATLSEIRSALGVLVKSGLARRNIILLQCHTEYPSRPSEINLRVMDTFRTKFGVRSGLSDHTLGINVSLAAAALGAAVIEKHFTLNRSLSGPDHKASLTPPELNTLVRGIREIEAALGNGIKKPTPREKKIMKQARKYLVAVQPIQKGGTFTLDNLGLKRSGGGIPAASYERYIGKRAICHYQPDEIIRQ